MGVLSVGQTEEVVGSQFSSDRRVRPQLVTLLELGRVSNLPTVYSNIAAAVLTGIGGTFAERNAHEVLVFTILCFFGTLIYCGGMFLNDFFDATYDSKHQRLACRPIPSGRISRSTVGFLGFAQLFVGFGIFAVSLWITNEYPSLASFLTGSLRPLAAATLLILCVLFYNVHHKTNPLAPFFMAACRAFLYFAIALFFVPIVSEWLQKLIMLNYVYLVGLTAIAKQEARSREKSGKGFVFALVAFCAVLGTMMVVFELPFFPMLGFMIFVVYLCLEAGRNFGTAGRNFGTAGRNFGTAGRNFGTAGRNFGHTIARFLAGICLLDGLVVYSVSGSAPLFLCFLALFFTTLLSQRLVLGT